MSDYELIDILLRPLEVIKSYNDEELKEFFDIALDVCNEEEYNILELFLKR